jgi:methylmalonyl-CoA mutase
MAELKEKLFEEFSPTTTEQWVEKITTDLKGAPFDKKLVWRTNEGFNVYPFYRLENVKDLKTINSLPGEFPYLRGNKKKDNTWFVRQDIKVSDPVEANKKALDVLNRGVDSLAFHLGHAEIDAKFIETLLNGILPQCVELNFCCCQKKVVNLANLLVAYFKKNNYPMAELKGSFDFDFIGKMMTRGHEMANGVETIKALIEATAELPQYQVVGVGAFNLQNAGSFIYQELGYALAWGNEYINLMTEAGVPAELANQKLRFNLGVSPNYFMEIAKFRAARLLWANIMATYTDNKEACKIHMHAVTSTYNLSVFDAHMNLLRTQTEAMSTALGGVDSMTVTPFDVTYEEPNDFSERLARNQQLLLKEESHMGRIVDVAGGSYYIENITVAIAEQAWKLFLAVEEDGGFYAQVKAGKVQAAVAESTKTRHANVAKRKEILVGTNQYPNFTEVSNGKKPVTCCCGCGEGEKEIATLNFDRAASEFEALRLETEAAAKRPIAFMLTIGNLAMRQARAQFSCNFLATAGYKVIDNLGFPTVEEGVDAALAADADIVVLCSSDDEYAEYAVPAFKYLNGRAMFIVAGAPACMEDLKAEGIENFIHVRCNVLETMKEYNAKLLKK